MTITFVDLPDDVLYKILPLCDFKSLFQLQTISKRLRAIVSECRDAWVSVLVNAPLGVAPSITPHRPLPSYSTRQLKDLATQAYMRRKMWSNPSKIVPTRIYSVSVDPESENSSVQTYLLPGGVHFLHLFVRLKNELTLDCYNVILQRRIWRWRLRLPYEVEPKDVDLGFEIGLGNVINIAVQVVPQTDDYDEITFYWDPPENKCYVYMLQRDLSSTNHTASRHHLMLRWATLEPVVAGNYVLLGCHEGVCILNWKNGKNVLVQTQEDQMDGMLETIVHQSLLYCSNSKEFKFHSVPLSALDQHWSEGSKRGELYVLSENTQDELVVAPHHRRRQRSVYSVLPPSWETAYLTRVVLVTTRTGPGINYHDPCTQFKLHFLTSTTPQRSHLEHVGPFSITAVIEVECPLMRGPYVFWCSRMGSGVFQVTMGHKFGIVSCFAFRPPDCDDVSVPVQPILVLDKFTYNRDSDRVRAPSIHDVDPYSGAILYGNHYKDPRRLTVCRFD